MWKQKGEGKMKTTKAELMDELTQLRQRVTESEASDTQRKQAEDALRESEERYRTILEQMEDAYYETDLAGNVSFVNDSICRLSGYSREELMGMDYRTWIEEQDFDTVHNTGERVYLTGEPAKELHWTYVRKDGTKWFVEAALFPLRNQQGETIGFRGISRDVTERKQMEEALKSERDKLQALMDGLARTEIGIDIIGLDYKVISQNQTLQERFGDLLQLAHHRRTP